MAAHIIPVEQARQQISLEEYLRTIFHPDCDFVDGWLEERNVGEFEHGRVQAALLKLFMNREGEWQIIVVPECRMQVSATRYRIPDVMVLRASQTVHRIVREAPLVCIEVLSPEDTWKRLRGVLSDYLAMGVPNIWAFDPEERQAYHFDADGFHPVTGPDLAVAGTEIRFPVAEVFALLPPAAAS